MSQVFHIPLQVKPLLNRPKFMLLNQKRGNAEMGYTPHKRLHKDIYVLNFFNYIQNDQTPSNDILVNHRLTKEKLRHLLGILKVENGKAPFH